ncbi:MAG: hypothetical protein BRD34_04030 [Bacteroidetes bacterium QH_6_64_77]|nr:MAG: hypothetical protein BRD34_04030 [Bacteroidetes bacterium QH_6_64_77]
MEEAWQFVITRSEAELLQDALRDEYETAYRKQSNPYSVLAAIHVEPGASRFCHREPQTASLGATFQHYRGKGGVTLVSGSAQMISECD